MPMDNVTLENTQQSISSRDAKSVASVMVNGKWVNLSDTLEQANVKSDVGTVSKQVAEQQTVITSAVAQADSAVAYANDAIEKSRVNQQAIVEINSAVSDAVSDAAVARSDSLRAWNAAQSNVDLIDQNYASASAAISSARTEAIAAADEAKASASAAQADIVAVRSDVAAVQADVTATQSDVATAKNDIAKAKSDATAGINAVRSDVATAKSDIADTKTSLTSQASALSDAKTELTSDVAVVKKLANTAQATADSAVKSVSSVADDLTAVASQAKANANGITKVTSDVGSLQTTVADNSGNISAIQETAKKIQQAVSDNAGNITVAKQTADSAVAVASDAKSNATAAIQTASQASITASNASDQAASAVLTAQGAMTTASDANSNATVAVQTASGASLTAINANSDATVAKQTASEAKVQASNAESDFAQLSIRANKIEANVANNSGAIASVQQTANGLTTTVGDVDDRVKKIEDKTKWATKTGALDMDTLTTTQNIYYRDTNLKNADGETGWAYIQVISMGERVTQTVWHDRSSIQHTRTGAVSGSSYNWDAWNKTATYAQVTEVKQSVDGIVTTINDVKGDVSQLKLSASSASVALSDAAGNISSLQATAKSYSAALSDTNSNVASVTATASELETKYADAAGDISQIKATAKGTAETIADAQGDIASLKKRADGFDTQFTNAKSDIAVIQSDATGTKETLANTKSDVAVLQSRADGFDVKYSDVASDVSTLQADAKGMTQTISNAQGDIAKLKTRADGFDTEFTTANGNISKLQTDASGTKQTLTNAKSDIAVLQSRADGFDTKYANTAGDINTLKADAKGFNQTLTNAKGDISTLQATATGLKNTLTDAQGNISTLQSDVSGLKKTTSDHAGNIATLQADAKTLTSQMSSAQGDISTLKQTASGFSSKVSGMETSLADATNKLDDITSNGGGRNLLRGTRDFSGVSIQGSKVAVTNGQEKFQAATGTQNPSQTWFDLVCFSAISLEKDTDYTASFWVKTSENVDIWSYLFDSGSNGNYADGAVVNHSTTDYTRVIVHFHNGNNTATPSFIPVRINKKSSITVWIYGCMLEKGVVAHDWQPSPEDIDAKITTNSAAIDQNKKAIALKADQTTVDKTNGTVQQLQSQLKVQAGQIDAKVSSSDLDAKGYATQTYTQTLVTQKANEWNLNLTSLKTDVNAIKTTGGGVNLLQGTRDFEQFGYLSKVAVTNGQETFQAVTGTQSSSSLYDLVTFENVPLEKDTDYTASFWVKTSENIDIVSFLFDSGSNGNYADGATVNHATTDYTRFVVHFHNGNNNATPNFIPVRIRKTGVTVWLYGCMFEKGTVAHTWSPAPSDMATVTSVTNLSATVDGIQAQVYNSDGSSRITQLSNLIATKVSSSDFDNLSKSVNLQTLDSADINNMKTNGHYFVHNLANNPISGWVYVDVTGNGNDRIRQDVYQDTGTKHCYRRWYGNYWTAWSQGATESEIIQLSDDINIRVKKGDVVSQINQEAGGNTLIQVSNGKGKLALNASSVIFSGSAFIPDAYISTLNADKLRFYDSSGNVATMSAGLEQYDDDKTKRSIVLKYSGGYEVHAADLLGSILTMHDNTIRLAVKANGMASSGNVDQYSGFYASQHYAQLSCYRSDGRAPGIFITDDGFTIKGDESGSGTKYGDLYIVSPQVHVRGSNAAQMQAGNVHAWLSNDGILNLYKDNDGGSATATKLQINGWAWVRGWVEAAGHSQHSALSTKTDIQSVDDDEMLKMVNSTDLATFLYKTDVANGETHRHIGLIIDDVHDVAQYQTPQDFIAPNGVSRDDDNMIGALFGAVKALTKRIKTLESKVG